MFLSKWKWSAIGAALLSFLAMFVRLKIVKKQRDKLKRVTETLKSRDSIVKEQKKLIKKEKIKAVERLERRQHELKKPVKDFKGLDNLSNPNDF